MHTNHKIIITGTGRAGTTFLVRLLTALRQPTGYTEDSWQSAYFPHCAAGLERKITDPSAPYIIKDPDLCVSLGNALAGGGFVIDHAIIPVRELDHAALSRIRIGGANGDVPGGLVGTATPERQRCILAERFHRLVHTLVVHDIPHTFLLFPRFVQDAAYAFAKLHPVFPQIEWNEFQAAFREIADVTLVHDFEPGHTPPPAETGAFREAEIRKHQLRRVRRVAGWSVAAFSIAVAWQLNAVWPIAGSARPDHANRPAVPVAAVRAAMSRPPSSLRLSPPEPSGPPSRTSVSNLLASTLGDYIPASLRFFEPIDPAITFTSAEGAPALAILTPPITQPDQH